MITGLQRCLTVLGPSWRNLIFGLALAGATLVGVFAPADRLLRDLNFALWSRPAADDLLLVEIDARSLQKLNSWPWSRAYHAALIQRLTQAGAKTIAFDIDFSAPSAPAADAAMAQAIAEAKSTVVLAAFAQPDVHAGASAAGADWALKSISKAMVLAPACFRRWISAA